MTAGHQPAEDGRGEAEADALPAGHDTGLFADELNEPWRHLQARAHAGLWRDLSC